MRILIAAMDPFLARDVGFVLAGGAYSLEQATDLEDGIQLARRYQFDAVLFGNGNSAGSGVEFIRRLRASGNALPAVAIAANLDGKARGRLLDAGADDVLDMPCDTNELCARLRAVVRRSRGYTRAVLSVGALELHMDSRSAVVRGSDLHLSPSEYKVLELMVLRKGMVVNKSALMDLLYGEFDEPDVKSLNVLMHRLRKRLATVNQGHLVRTVWGTGYMVDEPTRPLVPLAPMGVRVPVMNATMAMAD